jgi:hypothetical protein
MHTELRKKFNAGFAPEKYAALVRCVNETEKWPADFRISETPISFDPRFTDEIHARGEYTVFAVARYAGVCTARGIGGSEGIDKLK